VLAGEKLLSSKQNRFYGPGRLLYLTMYYFWFHENSSYLSMCLANKKHLQLQIFSPSWEYYLAEFHASKKNYRQILPFDLLFDLFGVGC
jgi:hypothetical protein